MCLTVVVALIVPIIPKCVARTAGYAIQRQRAVLNKETRSVRLKLKQRIAAQVKNVIKDVVYSALLTTTAVPAPSAAKRQGNVIRYSIIAKATMIVVKVSNVL